MESIIGIKFGRNGSAYTEHNIAACSLVSRGMFKFMIDKRPTTFSQILYPYADMLSLCGESGTESTQIFGTHMILHNIGNDIVAAALEYGMDFAVQNGLASDTAGDILPLQIIGFTPSDGYVAAEDIAEFLQCGCDAQTVGNFSEMLSGFIPHWRIREAAKVFASFSEMSYRVSKGLICGLSGGKLALYGETDAQTLNEIKKICFRKTGYR